MKAISFPIALAFLFMGSTVLAESFSTIEHINVTKSVPIYTEAEEEIPIEKCYDVKEDVSSPVSGNSDVIGAVVGGALGGVLGHQVGGGRGKTAATVGGAVLGTIAGQNIGSKYGASSGESYRIVRKCEVTKKIQSRQVISGYRNIGKIKGKEIVVESSQPLKRIPITITYTY